MVTINTAATKASAAAGNNDLSSPTDVSAWDVTINGTKIDFTGMTSATIDDVVNKINSYKDITGVEASNSSNYVKLDQMNYGSDAKIVVGGTDAAKVAGAVTAGVDAVVTIKDPENISQQITGLGQAIDYRGAEFIAKGAANYSATISVTSSGASLQIGANKDQSMLVDINEISTKTLGNATYGYIKDINLQTQDGANKAINVLDEAIKQVSQERSKLGAYQNRLEHTINNLGTSAENLTAAESRIRDVDMAKEMMEFTKDNILNQAATAMLEEIAA
nr:flagellin [Thermoanaerobacterium thermosaccharolyticum]